MKALNTTNGTIALVLLATYTQPTDGPQRWCFVVVWCPPLASSLAALRRTMTRSTREESGGARCRHRELSLLHSKRYWKLREVEGVAEFGLSRDLGNRKCNSNSQRFFAIRCQRDSDFLTHPTSLGTHIQMKHGRSLLGDPA
jgi:hypothetical protein